MNLRAWIAERSPRIGTLLTVDNPAIVEVARLAGFDFLWIDAEHGQFHDTAAALACALCQAGPAAAAPLAFVRAPDFSPTSIKRFLETGCDGIILPAVSTPADVDVIAAAALYPPRGQRSVGISRAHGYGATFRQYLETQSYSILVQIETRSGVENASAIAAHPAVDAVMIGPYDLSGSYGIPGQVDAPPVLEGIARVLEACRAADKPCGIFAATAEKARAYAAQGFELIAAGIDTSILLDAWKSLRNQL
jgi:2-keto-3-deoxy-L-rhamnonate aldolase RhmA